MENNVLFYYTPVYFFNTLFMKLIFSLLTSLVEFMCILIKHIASVLNS